MADEPPEQLVRDLLRGDPNDASTGMQSGNTFGLKPNIKYGWFDNEDLPAVIVRFPDENPLGGGETGYSAMAGDGSGPVQEKAGTVDLHVAARDYEIDAASTDFAAEYLRGSAADDGTVSGGVLAEIERIVEANASRPANPVTGNKPLRSIAPGSPTPVEEPDSVGPLVHYLYPVMYIRE